MLTNKLFNRACVARRMWFVLASVVSAFLLTLSDGHAQENGMPPRVTGARAVEAATQLRYLLDGQTAVRLMPSEMVIGQGVTRAEWSPDGRFVLAIRAPAVPQALAMPVSIAVWDKTTRRKVELWRRRLTSPVLAGPTQWMAKAQVGIVRWRWMEADENGDYSSKEGMVWVNAAQGTAREVDAQPGDEMCFSPLSPEGVILHGKPYILLQSISVIAPDGSFTPNVPAPEGARGGADRSAGKQTANNFL